jgi:predicted DNA-binding protein with PD1-like motif
MGKIIRCILTFLSAPIYAQETSNEITTISTQFKRIELIRMRPGTDLLEGLQHAIQEKDIKNAVILAGIGSVTEYHFHVVSDKNLPPSEEFPRASRALDLTTLQGYILNGRIHAHMTLADENNAFGGHVEPGTKSLTFFIITLGILPEEVSMENFDNYRR